jgi:glycosyltransferase involved in cell wall biosynthesis
MPKICIVIPTKNESPSIGVVLKEIQRELEELGCDDPVFIVVDDSQDETRRIAENFGAVVVRGDGDGLGSAMFKGLKTACQFNPNVILSIDGDGQADTAEIGRFLAPIEKDEADLVLGSRFLDRDLVKYKYRFRNRLGTIVLSRILRAQTGLQLTDSHGGIRAMRLEVAADLDMLGTHTYVQETIIDAAEKGHRILEIPSAWKKREHGRSRVVGSIPKYVFYTLPILILRSGQHIRYLYSLGIGLILTALAIFLYVLVEEQFHIKQMGSRTPAFLFIVMLVMTGLQFFFFGFVLQLLKQIKKGVDRRSR